MKLSVIILNYNVRYFLELCLTSVEAALVDIDSEIIVVDNNSPDDSCAMVKKQFPDVNLIENKDNSGFSKGNNIGVAVAKGDYLCILNPDTVVAEDTFTTLLEFANNQSKLGILGCKLIDGSGQYLPESKRNIPTPSVSFKKIFGFDNRYYANHLVSNETGQVDVLVGAFMLIKRAVYNEVNGFDEDYFMYGEDIDLSYRVLKAGYQNYYCSDATIIHFKGESTPKDAVYVKRFYNAMRIFYKKHFKRNFVFDSAVSLGVRVIPILNVFRKGDAIKGGHLEHRVLDNHKQSFKSIIQAIEQQDAQFRIRPKNSNFIIGSHSSKSQGDIELIE